MNGPQPTPTRHPGGRTCGSIVATFLAIVGVIVTLIVLSGCGNDNFRDTEGVPSHDADSYTLWNNVDDHPNLVRVCADGVAFLTTTRDYVAVTRVPEWDQHCPNASPR